MHAENEEDRLKKRFAELAERADAYGCRVWSEVLTMAQQDTLLKMKFPVPVSLHGGYDAAERRAACFGELGEDGEIPFTCVRISPLSKKFAEELSHRDVLGALMNLGLRREMLGDIVFNAGSAYLFCIETVAGFLIEQLERIKHTVVRCEIADSPPDLLSSPPEEKVFTVASERLDALVAAVYNLSRAESQALFAHQKIYVNSCLTENLSFSPKENDIVSVRGFGRFIYMGIRGETKKGRLRAAVGVYK